MVWNIDYTTRINRTNYSQIRNIEKEKSIESQITSLIRKAFYFRTIPAVGQERRMGKIGMESRLIGTVARCTLCSQSKNWLGKYSSLPRIRGGKLWLTQYLGSTILTESDQTYILEAITRAKERVKL